MTTFIKFMLWITVYFTLHMIFSVNTLFCLVCFIFVIFVNSLLMFHMHIEYINYLILLLYLGGIIIFFLFTAYIVSTQYQGRWEYLHFSFKGIILFLLMIKSFFCITSWNYEVCLFRHSKLAHYWPTFIENNYFIKTLISSQNDILDFINLYSDKGILLGVLGLILLFTMVAVIVITKK